jgi:hypothetical protein
MPIYDGIEFEIITKKPAKIIQLMDDDFYVNKDIGFIPTPKGFEFDGASIPKPTQFIIGHPLKGKFVKPARNHDYCFLTHCVPFSVANKLFYSDLLREGVGRTKAWFMYQAVSSAIGYYFYRRPEHLQLKLLENLLHNRPDGGFYEQYIKNKHYRRLGNA